MNAHTPGPWKLIDNGSVIMTSVLFEVQFGYEGECVAECIHTKEDARLIAAAPEMLAALEELVVLLEDVRSGDYTVDYFTDRPARQAIAKAKGE